MGHWLRYSFYAGTGAQTPGAETFPEKFAALVEMVPRANVRSDLLPLLAGEAGNAQLCLQRQRQAREV